MAESDTDRLKRVAHGVRRKLMGMAVSHASPSSHPEVGPHTQHAGPDMGPNRADQTGSDNAEFRHQEAEERASDLKANPPGQHDTETQAHKELAREQTREANRANSTTAMIEKLGHEMGSHQTNEKDQHEPAEMETDAEQHREGPDDTEPSSQEASVPNSDPIMGRHLGKTTRGIVSAYRQNKRR